MGLNDDCCVDDKKPDPDFVSVDSEGGLRPRKDRIKMKDVSV